RAGNPDIADNIELVAGSNTGWIMAEGMIATPGIVDAHVHLVTTSIIPAALSAGTTTVVGMGYGGIHDLGVNPAYNFHRLLEAWEGIPLNVAWRPALFGAKPQLVVKSGFVVWGPVGSGNDSTRLGQPQIYRPMFGSLGAAPASLGVAFVSRAAIDNGLARRVKLRRRLAAVRDARRVTNADFPYNQALPTV